MAANSLSSRLEELRSRNPQSPPGESVYSGYSTPKRFSGSFMHSHSQSVSTANDNRSSSLQRRFTADSNNFPSPLSPINYQQLQSMEPPLDMTANQTLFKAQALDKKRLELERFREQKKRMEDDLKRLDNLAEQQESEFARMANDFQGVNFSPGYQSEPATPPEYRDPSFTSVYTNRNRFSSASLTSPMGLNNRLSLSGSQITSPPPEPAQQNGSDSDKLPSKSVPASRRGSSDKFAQYIPDTGIIGQRSTVMSNRYSMPVTLSMRQKRESLPDFASSMGLSHIDTTSILFGDDDDGHEAVTSPDVKSYLQANTTEDKFPILVRSNHKPGTLSASSAALDLAFLQSSRSETNADAKTNGWPSFTNQRHSLQSMPGSIFESQQYMQQGLTSPSASSQQSVDTVVESPSATRKANRHSMEASIASFASKGSFSQGLSNGTALSRPNLANLQSSYSTNDIPTLKGSHGPGGNVTLASPPVKVQDAFHKHNASLGRIPPGAVNSRLSRDLSTNEPLQEESPTSVKPFQSDLQASAAPFGPSTTAGTPIEPSLLTSSGLQQFNGNAYYGGYGMSLLNMGGGAITPMQMSANSNAFGNGMQFYSPQNQFGSFAPPYNAMGRFPDSQARVIQQRRMQNAEDNARFSNTKIENYTGEIYSLCKDQHGCRYLQKQLETRNPQSVQLIFSETAPHVVELMTDPFGNYLCQKLLEHSNDEQRTVLVSNSAPQMVQIALNQHGTRALQKLIEYLSTPAQIQTVKDALKDKVVELIQDLNGNHVIQKCLNRLTSEDAQFIFDAVGTNCVVVGTHRHGCCVLQRCIDHASGNQKADLIAQITQNAFQLVQDPFGNYVLQYIVDLNDTNFTDPLCYYFTTRIVELSKHKFSSNVIEKCIRHAAPTVSTLMIDEMLNANELEKMLRDSFANYVVQTALDYAEPETRARLVDAIRPIMPSIRHTPHGRRIQSKLLASEGSSHVSSPISSPMPSHVMGRGMVGPGRMSGAQGPNGFYNPQNQNSFAMNGMAGQMAFNQPSMPVNGHNSRLSNGSTGYAQFNPINAQNSLHQAVPQAFSRAAQATGYNFF